MISTLCTTLTLLGAWSSAAAADLTVVISDLHLGLGRTSTGAWHPYEDFREAEQLGAFLRSDELSKHNVELVIDGDFLELWQSDDGACDHPEDKALGCGSAEALARVRAVTAAHAETMTALRDFADRVGNSVVILPGNHDAGTLFPAARGALLTAIGATRPGAVSFAPNGYWLSGGGRVLIEHGQQVGDDPNKLPNWPTPFVTSGSETYIERTWGENFVQKYYNEVERRFPLIDNIANESTGIVYALHALGLKGSAVEVMRFLHFFAIDQSFALVSDLGGDGKYVWDLPAARAFGPSLLVEALPPDAQDRPLLASAAKSLDPAMMDGLDDAAIQQLCDARLAASERETAAGRSALQLCPHSGALGKTAAHGFTRSKEQDFRPYLNGRRAALLKDNGGPKWAFQGYVYAHTHQVEEPWYPMSEAESWRPWVVNAGTWQRIISPAQLKSLAEQHGWSDAQVFERATYEDLPPCFSMIWIDLQPKKLAPDVRYWASQPGGGWGLQTEACALPGGV